MAAALVRALRGGRGPVGAATALGRRGLRGANPSREPLMRRSLASSNGTGGSGSGGHGAATGTGSLGCTGSTGAAGGVVGNYSGGGGGATGVDLLRKDVFGETRRLWDGYHKLCEADLKLFQEIGRLETENALNMVNAKVDLVSATYKVLGCAVLFFIGGAACMGPYIKDSLVHDTANQVEERIRLRKAKGEEGADKTAEASVNVDTK